MRKILVTRAAHQCENLCTLIEQQGWRAIRFPVIDIRIKEISTQELNYIYHIGSYQFIFFVSVNAVNFALRIFNGKIHLLKKVSCVAIGNATRLALEKHGLRVDLVPAMGFNSEAVLGLPELQILNAKSCLIIRGDGGRELLAKTLRERGAQVDYLEVYSRTLPLLDNRVVERDLLEKKISATVIYSGDALRNLLKILAKQEVQQNLLDVPLVVISKRVHLLAQQIGFKKIIIAEQASDIAMINALLYGEESG